ncbi:hypothetical protein MTO96_022673 [Rhipicephalus appendiculatus]
MWRIARFLDENKTLKSFNPAGCLFEPEHGADTYHVDHFGDVSSSVHPWLVALTRNKTLVQITLDLSWFNREECLKLLKALALHASLKKITVQRIRYEDAAVICRAIRETGAQQRFIFCESHINHDPAVMLTECKELSFVIFDSTATDELDPLRTTLSLLRSCNHVSTLILTVGWLTSEVSTLISLYVSSTKVLRCLSLCVSVSVDGNGTDRPGQALVQALSVNSSIRRLIIRGPCFDETETRALADALTSGRTVYSVRFLPDDYRSALSLVHRLSSRDFSTNYALTEMCLSAREELGSDWFAVSEVLRRNDSLVKRATWFVEGYSRHKYCAAALELVHFNSALVEAVQESQSVDANDAVLRVKRSLRSFSELDDFMRIVGVVKGRVACYERDDCQMQLVDLNRDCWLYLRQFLKVSDVLNEERVSP